MQRYYTKVCNFYYGNKSKFLVNKRKSLPLNGNKKISFDHVEIISRKSKKKKNFYSRSKKFIKKIKKTNYFRFKENYFQKKKFCQS